MMRLFGMALVLTLSYSAVEGWLQVGRPPSVSKRRISSLTHQHPKLQCQPQIRSDESPNRSLFSRLSHIKQKLNQFPVAFRKKSLLRLSLPVVMFVAFSLLSNRPAMASTLFVTPQQQADLAASAVTAPLAAATTAATSTLTTAPSLAAAAPRTVTTACIASPMSVWTEARLSLRLVYAAAVGAAVGKERSAKNHHTAGIRTMALVSLGAAAFTMCSAYGFHAGDPSRMASNVASGVGFVGAGVITTTSSERGDHKENFVHGLTTAAAIWLSAAVGVASGLGMYFIAGVAAASTIGILRVGLVTETLQSQRKWLMSPRNSRSSSSGRTTTAAAGTHNFEQRSNLNHQNTNRRKTSHDRIEDLERHIHENGSPKQSSASHDLQNDEFMLDKEEDDVVMVEMVSSSAAASSRNETTDNISS